MSADDSNDPIVTLLAELPRAAPRGFEQRVMLRVRRLALRRTVMLFSAWCCAIAGVALNFPVERFQTPLLALLKNTQSTWADAEIVNIVSQTEDWTWQLNSNDLILLLVAGAIFLVMSTLHLLRE